MNATDSAKLMKRCRQLVSESGKPVSVDVRRSIKKLVQIAHLPATKTREIVELFPDVPTDKPVSSCAKPINESRPGIEKKLLVLLLYVCNVSQEMLAPLFGVGKTSVHTWISAVGSEDLAWLILSAITCWSGKVAQGTAPQWTKTS